MPARWPRRILQKLRAAAAVAATMVAGYFSLATSCISGFDSHTVSLRIEFEEGEDVKYVQVQALAGSVSLQFNEPLMVPAMAGDDVPPELVLSVGGAGGAPPLEQNSAPEVLETDPIAHCLPENEPYATNCDFSESTSPSSDDDPAPHLTNIVVRLHRFDQVGAFSVLVTARGEFPRGCSGESPERTALRIEEVPE